jgi:hypothetical protein
MGAKYNLLNLRGNHLISILAAFVFVPSAFGGNISNSSIWNDIGRNCLLGKRKKIAKFFNVDFYLPLCLTVG